MKKIFPAIIILLISLTFKIYATHGVYNVLNYGADNTGVNDSYPAFAAAVADIVNGHVKNACVYIPGGTYRLDDQIHMRVSSYVNNALYTKFGLTILGDGIDNTVINVNNTNGFFWLDMEIDRNQVVFNVNDLTIAAQKQGSGSALKLTKVKLGVKPYRQVNFENIFIKSSDGSSYFDYGLYIYGPWYPVFKNVTVLGATNSFSMSQGFRGNDMYQAIMENIHIENAEYGIWHQGYTNPEDGIIDSLVTKNTKTGARIIPDNGTGIWDCEPAFHVWNSNIEYQEYGIWFSGVRQTFVHKNKFNLIGALPNSIAVFYDITSQGICYDNQFVNNSESASDKFIYFNNNFGYNFSLKNSFLGSGYGVYNFEYYFYNFAATNAYSSETIWHYDIHDTLITLDESQSTDILLDDDFDVASGGDINHELTRQKGYDATVSYSQFNTIALVTNAGTSAGRCKIPITSSSATYLSLQNNFTSAPNFSIEYDLIRLNGTTTREDDISFGANSLGGHAINNNGGIDIKFFEDGRYYVIVSGTGNNPTGIFSFSELDAGVNSELAIKITVSQSGFSGSGNAKVNLYINDKAYPLLSKAETNYTLVLENCLDNNYICFWGNSPVYELDNLMIKGIEDLTPAVIVTNMNAAVEFETTEYSFGGFVNGNVIGKINWSNQLTTEQGSFASEESWELQNIPIAVGSNNFTFTVTNINSEISTDTVIIFRNQDTNEYQTIFLDTFTVTSGGDANHQYDYGRQSGIAAPVDYNQFNTVVILTNEGTSAGKCRIPITSGGATYLSLKYNFTNSSNFSINYDLIRLNGSSTKEDDISFGTDVRGGHAQSGNGGVDIKFFENGNYHVTINNGVLTGVFHFPELDASSNAELNIKIDSFQDSFGAADGYVQMKINGTAYPLVSVGTTNYTLALGSGLNNNYICFWGNSPVYEIDNVCLKETMPIPEPAIYGLVIFLVSIYFYKREYNL